MSRSPRHIRVRGRDRRDSICAWCEQAIAEEHEVLGLGAKAVPGVDLRRHQGRMLSPERTLALWGKIFRCGAPKRRLLPDADPEDGTRTLLSERRGCAGGARLRLYTVRGGGFGWPGGEPVDLEAVMGPSGRDFKASQAAWDFLRGL